MEVAHPLFITEVITLVFSYSPINILCSFLLVCSHFSWMCDKDKMIPLLQGRIPNRDVSTLTLPQIIYLCRHIPSPKRVGVSNFFLVALSHGTPYRHRVMGAPTAGFSPIPVPCDIHELSPGKWGIYMLTIDGKLYCHSREETKLVDIPYPIIQIVGHQGDGSVLALDCQGRIRLGPHFVDTIPNLPYICSIVSRTIKANTPVCFVDVNSRYWTRSSTGGTYTVNDDHIDEEPKFIMLVAIVGSMYHYDGGTLRKDSSDNLWMVPEKEGDHHFLLPNVKEVCSNGKCALIISGDDIYHITFLQPTPGPKKITDFTPTKITFC